jgi:hypothetical protein
MKVGNLQMESPSIPAWLTSSWAWSCGRSLLPAFGSSARNLARPQREHCSPSAFSVGRGVTESFRSRYACRSRAALALGYELCGHDGRANTIPVTDPTTTFPLAE